MEIGTMGKIVNAINSYIYGFLLSSQCREQMHWPFDIKKTLFFPFPSCRCRHHKDECNVARIYA